MGTFIKKLNKIFHVNDEKCKKCKGVCNAIRFRQDFRNWTSNNKTIDKFIRNSQLSDCYTNNALEWIPHNRFYDISYIVKDEFRANWIDGCIDNWDNENQNWKREHQNMFISLKKLSDSKSIELKLNEIIEGHILSYGITQDPKTKHYMVVLDDICDKCNYVCNMILYQRDFKNWTSGNNDIDKFIQDSQHGNIINVLEWIPFNRFYNISYIEKDKLRANWIDGYINNWDIDNRNLKRKDQNMFIILKGLGDIKNITLELNEINKVHHKFYGVTQDPETKYYMVVLGDICEKCNHVCNMIRYQQDFKNWTSGNNDIDKFIQDSQHGNIINVLEWIPYNRFYNISYIEKDKLRANWIDGYINNWDVDNRNLKRKDQNMFIILKGLGDLKNITLELNEINKVHHKLYGVTQDPETKYYMVVLDDICEKCNHVCNMIRYQRDFKNWTSGNNNIDKLIQDSQLSDCYTNNALEWILYNRFYDINNIEEDKFRANWVDGRIYKWSFSDQNWIRKDQNTFVIMKNSNNLSNITLEFNEDFNNWTSGNNDIDKFIQDSQLSKHTDYEIKNVLEWIPYNRFYDIRYIKKDKFRANWIDGFIYNWDKDNKNWKRKNQIMFVILKSLSDSKNIKLQLNEINKVHHKFYGVTQDPETKYYMVVLGDICEKCNHVCNMIRYQQDFKNWTSGNNDIDKFIQDSQHGNIINVLEWIPYNRFYNISYIEKDKLRANWIDGYINNWDVDNRNLKRKDQNMFIILKGLGDLKNITLELNEINKVHHKLYGVTQDPETKYYMVVLDDICEKCNHVCNMIRYQRDFKNWTSGNNDIDKFIQDSQHGNIINVLEWIPYNRFCDIEYIAKGGFGKVYKANWIDGCIDNRDDVNQNWKRKNQNMFVALKILHNSKNVTSEFMNEIASHYKVNLGINIIRLYGLSQDPVTKNYIMVMDYAKNGSLRNYLNKNYNKLNWNYKLGYLQYLAFGLEHIHKNDLIHRDLHSGNVLVLSYAKITDLGLCKPADYTASENTKNNVYGILPYVAPEILRGQSYTKASDVYSIGILMYEIISGLPPYHDKNHNEDLAIKICKGLRPRFNINVPQSIVYLNKRCLDADPLNRPTIEEIKVIMNQWRYGPNEELQRQIKVAEEINNNLPTDIPSTNLGISYETHSGAIYKSRLLNYYSLPEPKNSDDYYKQNDNIISKEFSDSLQINISQLEIDDNNISE
ncbi:kinase-like domain-containing protein [Rhizophagus clarus]|uniref:Kinase-like domain-containing protein n=1 Tax=Rhizophagus clarus TaxID=94130 RepID=A0A8H3LLI9_9GLOM|nr:kinase-like domain-containing protein [Rhizophagus clarus]